MSFSVVIAAYEAERTLGSAIESVLRQTREDFEIVVVDDGSRDGTAAVAERFATEDARVHVHRQANAGPSAARNQGIALARKQYVSMLDSDDLLLPGYLAAMGGALDADPEAGFAYTNAWMFEEASGRFRRKPWPVWGKHAPISPSPERFAARLLQRNFIFAAVTLRRSALERAGGYNPNIGYSEDYELWLRLTGLGFRALQVPGPLAVKRERADSRTRDHAATRHHAAMKDGGLQARRAVLEHPVLPYFRELAEARIDEHHAAEERRSTPSERIRSRLRDAVAFATRPVRRPFQLTASPPADVARAFPEFVLGRDRPRSAAKGR